MFNIYIDKRLDHQIKQLGLLLKTRFHTYLQYLSIFHCCINIGVFNIEKQRKVILNVKQKCLNQTW